MAAVYLLFQNLRTKQFHKSLKKVLLNSFEETNKMILKIFQANYKITGAE